MGLVSWKRIFFTFQLNITLWNSKKIKIFFHIRKCGAKDDKNPIIGTAKKLIIAVDNIFYKKVCQNSIPNKKNIENINNFFLLRQSGEQIEDAGPPVVQLFLSDKKNGNISEESFQAFIDPPLEQLKKFKNILMIIKWENIYPLSIHGIKIIQMVFLNIFFFKFSYWKIF